MGGLDVWMGRETLQERNTSWSSRPWSLLGLFRYRWRVEGGEWREHFAGGERGVVLLVALREEEEEVFTCFGAH